MSSPKKQGESPEILLAILTDLSVDHRCWKWAKSLQDAGYRPVIVCDRPLNPLGAAWDGFEVRIITRVSHQRRFLPAFAEFLARLVPELFRSRARVWVSLDAPPLFWLALWGKLLGRTVAYDSHELFVETPLVLGRPSRRLFWRLWESLGFALIDKALTVSPAIVEALSARYSRVPFHLLPNMPMRDEGGPAPAPRALPSAPSPGSVRLIFQGGLRVATGLPELFLAMRTRPIFTLDVYGGGPEADALRTAAAAAELGDRVRFHGSVPFETLPARMAEAHIGIHLMQPVCGSFALTWANKIFDYARAGLPMVLSDNPAHRALLETHPVGLLADSFSPEAIGLALDALVAHHTRHAEACVRARTEWTWDAHFSGVPEFLEAGR